jgi:hypothetical protein
MSISFFRQNRPAHISTAQRVGDWVRFLPRYSVVIQPTSRLADFRMIQVMVETCFPQKALLRSHLFYALPIHLVPVQYNSDFLFFLKQ